MNSSVDTQRALAGGFDFRVHSTSGKLSQEDGRERLNGLRYESDEPRASYLVLVKLSSKRSWIRYPSRRFFLSACFNIDTAPSFSLSLSLSCSDTKSTNVGMYVPGTKEENELAFQSRIFSVD